MLDDDDFTAAAERVLDKAAAGEYKLFKCAHIYSLFLSFIDNGLLPANMERRLDAACLEGAEKAIAALDMSENYSLTPIKMLSELPKYQQFVRFVEQRMEKKQNEDKRRDANELFQLLADDVDAFVKRLYQLNNNALVPLFKYVDVLRFVETVLSLPNDQLVTVREAVANRYQAVNIGQFLHEERDQLRRINEAIDAEVLRRPPHRLSTYLLAQFARELEQIVAKLQRNPASGG